ncbi:hypothetical protein [Wenyingzhuangia sp. IMCC45574]
MNTIYAMKKRHLLRIAIFIFATSISSCSKKKESVEFDANQLVIESFSLTNDSLIYGKTMSINVNLGEEVPKEAKIDWLSSGGTFTGANRTGATWKAPDLKGKYEIAIKLKYKDESRQYTIASPIVLGRYHEDFKNLKTSIWQKHFNLTTHTHNDNALEIDLKGATKYAATLVNLTPPLGTENKLPQAASFKINSIPFNFKIDEDNYTIYYAFEKPLNSGDKKYLSSIRIKIHPSAKKYTTQIVYTNPTNNGTDSYTFNPTNSFTTNDWKADNTNLVGIKISKEFDFEFYFNKKEIFKSNLKAGMDQQNIAYDSDVLINSIFINNNGRIIIQELILDDTDQQIYDYDNEIKL